MNGILDPVAFSLSLSLTLSLSLSLSHSLSLSLSFSLFLSLSLSRSPVCHRFGRRRRRRCLGASILYPNVRR